MLKKSNKIILLISIIFLFMTGCSHKESIGKMMLKSSNTETKDLDLKKELAKKWEKGSTLLTKGKDQVEDGQDYIEKGNDLVEEGEENVAEGKKLIEESEKTFEIKFPDIKLTR